MYVPGKMKDGDKVLVDIGTGYYVEKVTQRVEYMCDLFLKLILFNKCTYFSRQRSVRGRSGET